MQCVSARNEKKAAGGLFAWAIDTLHVMNHNGISAHIIGSVLTDIISDDEFRTGSQARSLELINGRLSDHYRQCGIADRVVISLKVLNAEKTTHQHPEEASARERPAPGRCQHPEEASTRKRPAPGRGQRPESSQAHRE